MLKATYMVPLKKNHVAVQQDSWEKISVEILSVHNFVKDNQHSIYKMKSKVPLALVLSFWPAVDAVEQFGFTSQEAYGE